MALRGFEGFWEGLGLLERLGWFRRLVGLGLEGLRRVVGFGFEGIHKAGEFIIKLIFWLSRRF